MMMQEGKRLVYWLRRDWLFRKADMPLESALILEDSLWEKVKIPHDWAIGGAFDRNNDLQYLAIIEDGERKAADHTGRTGGLPHVGIAWYKKKLDIPAAWEGKRIYIEFDGIMSHSTIYINGWVVGGRPYGYSSFYIDITAHLQFGGTNTLLVRVDNKPCASRWYPGAGIYRHVRLVVVDPVHVTPWGVSITTPVITKDEALVDIEVKVADWTSPADRTENAGENHAGQADRTEQADRDITILFTVLDPADEVVGREREQVVRAEKQPTSSGSLYTCRRQIKVSRPELWSVENPQLYKAVIEIEVNGAAVDRYEVPFGIRSLRFDAREGFFLNDVHLKLKGVCMHHDLGALGTAINRCALQRQLQILKEMGCNAIRTSHNPPAPELLELCDTMGFLVIDEAFDEWRVKKVDNGYHILFDEWAERDLRDMIRRDRNHPCIIMWSIGNEVGDQRWEHGAETARFLTQICHEEDPTRPVTAGFNQIDAAIQNGLAAAVDIPGWNYGCDRYIELHEKYPDWIMYGSETDSCISSRGEYYLPVADERDVLRPSLHCNSYDTSSPSWGYPPDFEFAAQDVCPFILGQFTWTGFDYLGEPTPYKTEWPSRSSYFGIVDLCGIPKDRYYLYRSRWSPKPTLHLLPHWNWEGREGEIIPVHCYTNFPAAELFLNGKSLGVQRKMPVAAGAEGSEGLKLIKRNNNQTDLGWPYTCFRLMWPVPYEPGTLRVVAYDETGQAVMSHQIETAGAPARIELVPDRMEIKADGEELCFITAQVVDTRGNLCPHALHRVAFRLEGPAVVVVVDNGDQTGLEPFKSHTCRFFNGRCLVIVQALEDKTGRVTVRASAEGLKEGLATFEVTG